MKNLNVSVLFVFLLVFGLGCNYQLTKKGGQGDNSKSATEQAPKVLNVEGDQIVLKLSDGREVTIKSNEVTYELIGASIISRYCIECHEGSSAPSGSDLSNYLGVRKWLPRVLVRMNDGTMPPSGEKPTEAEIRTVEIWSDNGSPEK